MKIHRHFAQYSPEFWEARKGKATASNAKRILTPTGKLSASATDYIAELAADLCALTPNFFTEGPSTPDMRHGIACEPQARDFLAMQLTADILQVGGCETDDGRFWSSPDGLIEASQTVVELKCPTLKTHMSYLIDPNKLLQDYKPQCHFHLLVTGWPRCLLVSYAAVKEKPALVLTVEPDDYTAKLKNAAELFWQQFQDTLKRLGMVPAPEQALEKIGRM